MADAAAGAKPNSEGAQGDKGAQPDAAAVAAAAAAAAAAAGDKGKEGDKGAEGDKGGKAGDPPARVVPDKYTLKAPDQARLTAADITAIAALAKEEKWTNEEAQAHVDAMHQARIDQSTRFLTDLTADKDYGGEKLAESQRLANMALDRIRPKGTARGDALREVLVNEGLGNNVHFVSMLADIGKLMDEDKPLSGKPAGGSDQRDAAAKFYDHPTSVKLQEQTTRS